MSGRSLRLLAVCLVALGVQAGPAAADHDGNPDAAGMAQLSAFPNATGAINSDLAFWGDRAYAGNYDGFRIFDVSNPATPVQLVDFRCRGPQNDPVVWRNRLLFLAVDRTQTRPDCGSTDTAEHDDPNGWEGVRIFDVSNPAAPRFLNAVYTDCGAHTITLFPKNREQLLLYVSSYPLRPGPTCGPVRGPEAGNSPLHEKLSVIRVPVDRPERARVIAEPEVSYPGDPDNRFEPSEHGLPAGVFNPLTGCHDIGVFVEARLAAAACAEQAQLWRIKGNGIPDTRRPLWVYDDGVDTDGPGGGDVAVDFWHSATFSWDGRVVNFIDESFGSGCPTTTPGLGTGGRAGDTGRAFFMDTATGRKLSHFFHSRPEPGVYCSAHVGNVVPTTDGRDLLVNAWYEAGVDVIDFSDPRDPEEVAFYDAQSDNWAAYWYEGPSLPEPSLTVYGSDGVEKPETGKGFQSFVASLRADEVRLGHLNPQTQERLIGADRAPEVRRDRGGSSGRSARASRRGGGRDGAGAARARHLAP